MIETHPSGFITIDGEPFFLAKDDNGNPTWDTQPMPTQEGDPTQNRRARWRDWSRGMGDSRGVLRGTVEYAEAYLATMGRILPPPKIDTIETNCNDIVKDIEELPADSRIAVAGGTTVVEVDPSDHSVAWTETLTGADVLSLQRWDGNQMAVACGDTVDYYVRSSGLPPTYTQNSISKKARAFGIGADGKLVRGYQDTWSSCDAQNITGTNNWSTEYKIGDRTKNVQQVFSHNRWDYVLKDEGLYTFVEDTSDEANALEDLEAFASSENRWVFKWYSHIFVCTYAGLYRYIQQGAARTVGIEEVQMNESELKDAYPTAGVAFGRCMWVAYHDGTSTWIVQFRRAKEGDTGMGSPFTAISVIDKFTGECRAMRISALSGSPRVYYGAEKDVKHFALTRDGEPLKYKSSGTFEVRLAPSDFGNPSTLKQFKNIEMVGRNLSANRTVQWKAAFDGGSENNVGSAVTSLSSTFAEVSWTRGTNDQGRVLQLIATIAVDSETTPPEIREIAVDYEDRPEVVPGAVAGLRLRDEDSEGDVTSLKSAKELRDLIEGHMDGPLVQITDPWGQTYPARITRYEGSIPWQYRGEEPSIDMTIQIRKLAYAG